MSTTNTSPNTQDVIKRGHEIYESKKAELELGNNGKYITIEVNSGDYFIGNTREEAVSAARIKHPKVILYVRRIGVLEKVARHSPHYPLGNSYDRVL